MFRIAPEPLYAIDVVMGAFVHERFGEIDHMMLPSRIA